MANEVEQLRELAKSFWAGREIRCPKHPAFKMKGEFVQTTFADHVVLTCSGPKKESITIPQRPKQIEYNAQQVEGFVENMQRGDQNLCYRCQSKLDVVADENPDNGVTDYTFTCVRCFSYGTWKGHPSAAKIGSSPTSGTRKKSAGNAG